MDTHGVKSHFILLAGFPNKEPSGVVVFLEAVLANMFGAFYHHKHHALRHQLLPVVGKHRTCNRCCPMLTSDLSMLYKNISDAKQLSLLTKMVDGGAFKITNGHSGSRGNQIKYGFQLSSLRMHIPLETATRLHLAIGCHVEVRFIITDAPSPTAWSTAATHLDDASRMSIELTYGNVSAWLHRDAASGIACANTMFDWMMGKLSNIREMQEQDWGSDRCPFFGPLKESVSLASWDKTLVSAAEREAATAAGTPLVPRWTMRAGKGGRAEVGIYARGRPPKSGKRKRDEDESE